jgi:hypothetical protein
MVSLAGCPTPTVYEPPEEKPIGSIEADPDYAFAAYYTNPESGWPVLLLGDEAGNLSMPRLFDSDGVEADRRIDGWYPLANGRFALKADSSVYIVNPKTGAVEPLPSSITDCWQFYENGGRYIWSDAGARNIYVTDASSGETILSATQSHSGYGYFYVTEGGSVVTKDKLFPPDGGPPLDYDPSPDSYTYRSSYIYGPDGTLYAHSAYSGGTYALFSVEVTNGAADVSIVHQEADGVESYQTLFNDGNGIHDDDAYLYGGGTDGVMFRLSWSGYSPSVIRTDFPDGFGHTISLGFDWRWKSGGPISVRPANSTSNYVELFDEYPGERHVLMGPYVIYEKYVSATEIGQFYVSMYDQTEKRLDGVGANNLEWSPVFMSRI